MAPAPRASRPPDRLPDPRGCCGHVEMPHAERRQRVHHGVHDGGGRGDGAGLAASLHAEPVGAAWKVAVSGRPRRREYRLRAAAHNPSASPTGSARSRHRTARARTAPARCPAPRRHGPGPASGADRAGGRSHRRSRSGRASPCRSQGRSRLRRHGSHWETCSGRRDALPGAPDPARRRRRATGRRRAPPPRG